MLWRHLTRRSLMASVSRDSHPGWFSAHIMWVPSPNLQLFPQLLSRVHSWRFLGYNFKVEPFRNKSSLHPSLGTFHLLRTEALLLPWEQRSSSSSSLGLSLEASLGTEVSPFPFGAKVLIWSIPVQTSHEITAASASAYLSAGAFANKHELNTPLPISSWNYNGYSDIS